MRTTLVLAAAVVAVFVAALVGASSAKAEPFYCDGVSPDSWYAVVECGNTGSCVWVDFGGGWGAWICREPPCYGCS